MTASPEQVAATAFHEAGHCIVARVQRHHRITALTIDAATGAGEIRYLTPAWRRSMQSERGDAIARALGGPAGEALYLGLDPCDLALAERALPGAAADFQAARRAAGSGWGAEWRLAQAWARTVRILQHRWAAVELLARALLARGALDGDGVREALREGSSHTGARS